MRAVDETHALFSLLGAVFSTGTMMAFLQSGCASGQVDARANPIAARSRLPLKVITFLATLIFELCLSDIQCILDFHVPQLEFNLLYERPDEGYAFLALGGAQIMLELAASVGTMTGNKTEEEMQRAVKPAYPLGRAITLQIEIEDVGVYVERLRQTGHPLALEPHDKWFRTDGELSGSRSLPVTDPGGYLIRLAEYLGTRPLEPL